MTFDEFKVLLKTSFAKMPIDELQMIADLIKDECNKRLNQSNKDLN
jgi:hypothetical protein